jgi:hypothetical protein
MSMVNKQYLFVYPRNRYENYTDMSNSSILIFMMGSNYFRETSKVTDTRDIPLPTEDRIPLSASQDSQTSQAVTSVAGNRNNSTSTLSTVSSTRSTRSQNPEFVARHRNFLHKLHLTSNNITDEELLTDDESSTSKTTSKSSGSVQAEENSGSVVDSVAVRRKRERSASIGTLSPRIPSPGVASLVGGSASANDSGSSSPTGSQMLPATKKRRSTRTDSTGAQVSCYIKMQFYWCLSLREASRMFWTSYTVDSLLSS